ncbi:hypothetical protein [Aeromicrobium sp. 179-A 4D2 NHS]|uniref:hypothetical protein n=1 Tax=Aeromicrobium sp. 179-A 4D2 NHS TaxID=3142375 RepID=UPI0039A38964
MPRSSSLQDRSRAAEEQRISDALDRYGAVPAREMGQMLDLQADRPERVARQRHRAGDLIAVWTDEGLIYPYFQIRGGTPHPVIAKMRRLATSHGWTERDLLLWLVSPERHLDGAPVPAEMVANPANEATLLRALAARLVRDAT